MHPVRCDINIIRTNYCEHYSFAFENPGLGFILFFVSKIYAVKKNCDFSTRFDLLQGDVIVQYVNSNEIALDLILILMTVSFFFCLMF
jgi:hypothetical protein